MIIQDKIYGNFEVGDPIFIELINSPSLQRLKGVSQQGMPREYFHREVFSRFDHSIGVFLLLRKLGASIEEQIAGLLHDISHTAFSHVIDWVIGDPSKEDYQDNTFLEVLRKSDIPTILVKYDLNIEKISNFEHFTLLERELPSLCADRIDYSLRELIEMGEEERVKRIVNNISSINGQIILKTKEMAEEFGRIFAKLQREVWAGNQARVRYHILSEVLKKAIDKNHLSLNDFLKTDKEILEFLEGLNDEDIKNGIKKLKEGFEIIEVENSKGIHLKKKFRYVDPEVLIDGGIKKLSFLSKDYSDFLVQEMDHSKKDIFIEID